MYRDEEEEEEDNDEAGKESGAEAMVPASRGDKKILILSLLEGSKNRRQRAWAVAEPPHVVIGNPRALSRLVEQVRT